MLQKLLSEPKLLGDNLAKAVDYLVIGESIPGGTTTALGVLSALGVKAEGKVSSTLPENPHSLKAETVQAGLKAAGENFGSLAKNPVKAISCVGDPMMAALLRISYWCGSQAPVLMAGGTQMTAILALLTL